MHCFVQFLRLLRRFRQQVRLFDVVSNEILKLLKEIQIGINESPEHLFGFFSHVIHENVMYIDWCAISVHKL